MFLLGTWQLHRLQLKKELINEVSQSYNKISESFNINSKLYNKVRVQGKIVNQPIFVYNLGKKGQYGYDLYIPIDTNEVILLVKYGWTEKKFNLDRKDININVSFNAILFNPKRKNLFTPDNSKDLIFFLDMKDLQKNFKKNLFPFIAENRSPILGKYNLEKPQKIQLPNNHLQYALTWYSLCFVIIIAFLIYKRKL